MPRAPNLPLCCAYALPKLSCIMLKSPDPSCDMSRTPRPLLRMEPLTPPAPCLCPARSLLHSAYALPDPSCTVLMLGLTPPAPGLWPRPTPGAVPMPCLIPPAPCLCPARPLLLCLCPARSLLGCAHAPPNPFCVVPVAPPDPSCIVPMPRPTPPASCLCPALLRCAFGPLTAPV